MDSSQDKDLPATDRRLQQARDDGQVARSKDLTNLVVLGGGFWLVVNFFPEALSRLD
jgi:flagellar biosynthetic protein FlhB